MIPYYVACAIQTCSTLSRGEDIWCSTCQRSLCRSHFDSWRHGCRYTDLDPEPDLTTRCLRDLDLDRIQERAEILRPDHTCTVETNTGPGSTYVAGGCNVHVRLVYDDGVEWFLRVPLYEHTPAPPEMLRRGRHSEFLTYQVLHECGVSVPAARSWGVEDLSRSRDPHFTYIIYDKIEGNPVHLRDLDADKLPHLIDTFAQQNIRLLGAPYRKIGSLDINSSGEVMAGDIVDLRHLARREKPYFKGPFLSMRDYYLYQIDEELQAIRAGETYRQDPVMGYLIHLELRDLVRKTEALDDSEKTFFLRHPDSHFRNLLLSEDGEISGVLDWEWAFTVCKTAAFASPKWMWDTVAFWAGDDALNDDERLLCSSYEKLGRADLADCVRGARVHQRLELVIGDTDLLSETIGPDSNYMLRSIRPLLATLHPRYSSDFPSTMVEWRARLMASHGTDSDLGGVQLLLESSRKTRKPSWAYRIVPKRYWSMLRWICGEGTRG